MNSVIERILAGFQYILPQHFLSRLVYALMRSEIKWMKNLLISLISRVAGINYGEALSPDPEDYVSFNAWFTRALKPGARVFDPDPNAFLSPCDGKISETGPLQENRPTRYNTRWAVRRCRFSRKQSSRVPRVSTAPGSSFSTAHPSASTSPRSSGANPLGQVGGSRGKG